MTTTFEDNTAVTAEDLNNIAVDLGSTTFSAFSDEKFGVDKLNEITADLVTAGILKTETDSSGIAVMGCKPYASGENLCIGKGKLVFNSGAKITIEESVSTELTAGTYVYAFNDVTIGKASIQVSQSSPTEGDYVMLARIEADGSVCDLREYAKTKALSTTDGVLRNFTQETEGAGIEYTVDVGAGFTYFVLWNIKGTSRTYTYGTNAVELADGGTVSITMSTSSDGGYYAELHIKRVGDCLTMWTDDSISYYSGACTINFGVI